MSFAARTRNWVGAGWLATLLVLPSAACRAQDGEAALRTGKYAEAVSAYTRATESEPANVPARRGLIRALMETGRYEDAERFARAATGPAAVEASNSLGEALYARGDVAGAEAAFRKAIEGGASDSLTAQANLAVLLYNRGARDEAMSRFDRFIDIYNNSESLSSEALTAVGTAVRYLGARDPQLFRDALKAFDEASTANPNDLEPRVRLGELFLEKYNSPDAQSSLREVLAVNPNHPRALLGMARAKVFDGSPESMELVRKSLEINPNLIPARVLLARLLLEQEEDRAAEQEIQKALAVNPASLEALSILAAIHYMRGNQPAYEEVRSRVLGLNPRYADLYTTVAEMAIRGRRYREASDLARQAVTLDADSWSALGVLGINDLRLGKVTEAQQSLDRAFKGDPYNVWIKNTLDLLDTFGRYRSVKTPRFELVLREDEADLLGVYAAELAEEAYTKLAQRYGYQPEAPVRVEFYPSHADFSVRSVGLAGLGALGVAFGNVLALDAPSAREKGQFNWGSTLWHEITHAVTLGLSNHRVPRWLTEGLSVLEERRARPGWGDDISPEFLVAFQQGQLLPASEMNTGFVRPRTAEHLAFSYYQASLVAEMIESEYGFDAILQMLRGYGQGRSTEQLFRTVLRSEPEAFDKRFEAYVRQRFAPALAAVRGGGEGVAGGEFATALLRGQQAYEQNRLDEAKTHLERARTLFPQYAGDDSPYRMLAAIHKKQGNNRAAADELAKMTAVNENAYDANMELAELLEALGDVEGAAAALERTAYIFPYEVPVHTRLAALYQKSGNAQKAVRERRAVVALNPVDRAEALYQLAQALMQAGDREGARREVLRALEEAPNFEKAQELLLQLRGSSGDRE